MTRSEALDEAAMLERKARLALDECERVDSVWVAFSYALIAEASKDLAKAYKVLAPVLP